MPEGPQPLPAKLSCQGCDHLTTEWWKDYLENDETDSGTSGTCTKVDRNISAYWSANSAPPSWCPFFIT